MITLEKAFKLRELIVKASASLSDTDALDGVELFSHWDGDGHVYHDDKDPEYKQDRVSYDGQLYKCITAHTSQTTWTPTDSPSLWVRVDDPTIEFPEWVQPMGSTDAYAYGAKVSHNSKHWISTLDANVYEPGVYGWDEVA